MKSVDRVNIDTKQSFEVFFGCLTEVFASNREFWHEKMLMMPLELPHQIIYDELFVIKKNKI